MRRFTSLSLAAAVGLTGCLEQDTRIPRQLASPDAVLVPPPTLPDVLGGALPMAPDAAPQPSDGALEQAPDTQAAVDPATLGNGAEEARAMLEQPEWDNAAKLETWCKASLARAEAHRARFSRNEVEAKDALATFNTILLEVDTLDGYSSLMFNVSPVKEVRDVAEKCRVDLSKFSSNLSLDRSVYDAISKVPMDGADAITTHFVEKMLRDYRRSGVDKDDATRARIAEINDELTKLGQEFQKNINSDTRKIELTDEASLDGLPDDWKAAHPKNAEGKVVVTTDYPDLMPFLTYSNDAAARRALQSAAAGRGYPQNGEILKKIMTLRAEYAKLVGYANYAAWDLSDKMSGTPEVVENFIMEAKRAAQPRIDKDLETLLARKQKDDKAAEKVEMSDRHYLINKVRAEKYEFDAKAVREYFPYAKVKDGIFALYGELFGVEFAPITDGKTWHPAVEAWEMKREGALIGRFYLDNHPREDKYKHAAMFPIQTGLEGDRIPWASLVCNFPNPADGEALMEHDDVVTFFHEFGHLIHHLLARKGEWVATSGINVEWDFVEAPSQLLEEWAWDAKVLARFAKNNKDKAIPAKLVERMKAAEEFGKGVELARQIFFAAYSYHLHAQDAATLDLEAFTEELYAKWSPYPRPEGDKIYANFGHLIGYKSAYYTYQWSLAIAKDLFGRFKDKGLLDKEVAADYRAKVLEPGGTKKADALITDFLGRERNLEAYREWIEK
jgi:thimet oligopeptidase